MSNQKITTQNDSMQTSLFPELKENKKPKENWFPLSNPTTINKFKLFMISKH